MSLDLKDFHLPGRWDLYLKQIEKASEKFWTGHHIHSYVRLQSMKTWHELRCWLLKISKTMLTQQLTTFETFMIHSAAYLYEVGWQYPNRTQFSIAECYTESGRMIRQSRDATRRDYDFGLFNLDDTTVEVLAQLCSAVGSIDLSSLSIHPKPAGYQETVRLRYLAALLQLADLLLYGRRVNQNIIYSIPSLDPANPTDARLALLPYIKLIDLQQGGLTVSFKIHPDDEHLIEKIIALYEEPIRLWWHSNWEWLSREFNFAFTILTPEIMHDTVPPPPLADTCKALVPFLETFQPSKLPLPEASQSEDAKEGVLREIINPKTRTSAFICYSHKDEKFLKELQIHLAPYVRNEGLHIWDDTMIQAGSKLNDAIEKALHETKVAVLLVSAEFLASESIANKELPFLLAAAKREGAIILPVILTTCAFDYSGLGQFKAFNTPSNPLKPMKPADRDKVWTRVAERVRDALKEQP